MNDTISDGLWAQASSKIKIRDGDDARGKGQTGGTIPLSSSLNVDYDTVSIFTVV
jgi:hypothetical protein